VTERNRSIAGQGPRNTLERGNPRGMIRAVLDANVLISAAIRPSGPPGKIVTAFLARDMFELVISPIIAAEVEAALRLPKIRRYLREPNEALSWLVDLVALGDLVSDSGRVKGVCRDPDDAILAAAIEGRARAIVTGDADLLALGAYEDIAIMTPRAFLDLIER
jgi:putative PIN family toxin of toxin-antitoxin system